MERIGPSFNILKLGGFLEEPILAPSGRWPFPRHGSCYQRGGWVLTTRIRSEGAMSVEQMTTTPRSVFQVGAHVVRLACSEGRWTVTVDARGCEKWFTSEADAWEAGVREADRLDRSRAG